MNESIHAVLGNAQAANATLQRAWTTLKPYLLAGHQFVLEIKPATRSREQNAKFHAMCGDIARAVPWGGKPRSTAEWKVLLVSGHAKATNEGYDILPGLEGEFVNLRESTAAMSKKRSASLIDYTQAIGDLYDVEWSHQEETA